MHENKKCINLPISLRTTQSKQNVARLYSSPRFTTSLISGMGSTSPHFYELQNDFDLIPGIAGTDVVTCSSKIGGVNKVIRGQAIIEIWIFEKNLNYIFIKVKHFNSKLSLALILVSLPRCNKPRCNQQVLFYMLRLQYSLHFNAYITISSSDNLLSITIIQIYKLLIQFPPITTSENLSRVNQFSLEKATKYCQLSI